VVLQSLASCPTLPAEVDQPLAAILRRAQQAARASSWLARGTPWWDVAEAWTAMDFARREIGPAVLGGPRVLVALAVAAHLTDGAARARLEAIDCGAPLVGDCPEALPAGIEAARRALADPVDRELADAWIATCGLALVRVLAEARTGAPGLIGPAAAIRIAQRTVVARFPVHRPLTESGFARLACLDRRIVARWRADGAPSPANKGCLVTAAECAEFTGMTAKRWRELSAHGGVPAPVARRRTTDLWDEAEVLRWVAGRPDAGEGSAAGRPTGTT